MSTIKWVTQLPPSHNIRGVTIPYWELDAKPGQWGILRTYKRIQSAYPTATRLRLRLRPKGYEIAVRSDGNGGGILYGRRLKK